MPTMLITPNSKKKWVTFTPVTYITEKIARETKLELKFSNRRTVFYKIWHIEYLVEKVLLLYVILNNFL
jgi:hypothetical protein